MNQRTQPGPRPFSVAAPRSGDEPSLCNSQAGEKVTPRSGDEPGFDTNDMLVDGIPPRSGDLPLPKSPHEGANENGCHQQSPTEEQTLDPVPNRSPSRRDRVGGRASRRRRRDCSAVDAAMGRDFVLSKVAGTVGLVSTKIALVSFGPHGRIAVAAQWTTLRTAARRGS